MARAIQWGDCSSPDITKSQSAHPWPATCTHACTYKLTRTHTYRNCTRLYTHTLQLTTCARTPPQEYEATPVEDFAKALLRGMGWNDGEGVGRSRQNVEVKQIVPRPERLGLGADPAALPQHLQRPRVVKMGERGHRRGATNGRGRGRGAPGAVDYGPSQGIAAGPCVQWRQLQHAVGVAPVTAPPTAIASSCTRGRRALWPHGSPAPANP
jgi:hypothetical protein